MKSIDDLLQSFGGPRPFSEITGINYSTVVAFKSRNSVPIEYWKKIEAHAKHRKIEGVDRHSLMDVMLAKYDDVVIATEKVKGRPRPAARVASSA